MYTLFEKQIKDYEGHLKILKQSDKTIKAYTQHINCFLEWIIAKGIYDLREIIYEHIKEYQLMLMNELDKRYTINTIHLKLRSIKQFFAYLEKTKLLLYNPADKMILPSLGDRLPKVILTEKEMEKLLLMPNTGTFAGIRDRALLELLYSTGLRREECANLKVYDVDYKGGYLRVNQGKGGKDRILPLGKKACDWIKEYILKVRPHYTSPVRAHSRQERLTSNGAGNNSDERNLFINIFSQPLSSQSVGLIVKRHAMNAKIGKQVTTHAIRRSFATHMLKNEANPMYIQRILGHSRIEILNRYIKVAGIDLKKTHKKTHPREKSTR